MLERDLTGQGQRGNPGSHRAGLGIMAVVGLVSLLAAACSSSPASQGAGQHQQAGGSPSAPPPAQVTITPADGSTHARPNKGISVKVSSGKISNVTVTAGKSQVGGTLAAGATAWHTNWPLRTGTHYKVTVAAVSSKGRASTTVSSFRTLTPATTFSASTILGLNQTYGVGMPITINFSQPVTHKAAVEKAISIKSSKPVVGAWMWDGDQTLAFRPRTYWRQHTKVSFVAHFNGVQAAPGVYGTTNLRQSFRIGNSLIGKYYATWADSSGMPGRDTANGTYLTIEKANPTLMSGPGYHNLPVYWSVRFTWSGNYYHAAPWSLGEQGFINVSHGCVNLSPQHAQWYYERSNPGDPITITGSPVAGTWDDGYTQWFYTWKQALKHSATHMAVQAGPTGSTMVDPSTLPAQTTVTYLTGSKPHNFRAK